MRTRGYVRRSLGSLARRYTRTAGLSPIAVPPALRWQYSSEFQVVRDGPIYRTTYNPDHDLPPALTPLYVRVGGSNSNSGLDWANAFATPSRAQNEAKNATPGTHGRVYIETGVYPEGQNSNTPDNSFAWIAVDDPSLGIGDGSGRVRIPRADAPATISWSANASHYQATYGTEVDTVLDFTDLDAEGHPQPLTRLTTSAGVNATPGSWAQLLGVVYVRLSDDRAPDGDVYLLKDTVAGYTLNGAGLTGDHTYFYRGLEWLGGNAPFIASNFDGARSFRLVCDGCVAAHASTSNAFSITNIRDVRMVDSAALHSEQDGFNYHYSASDFASRYARVLEDGCLARNAGRGSGGSDQLSSLHDKAVGVRTNCRFLTASGEGLADVGESQSVLASVHVTDGSGLGDFAFQDTDAWLHKCSTVGSGNATSVHQSNTSGSNQVTLIDDGDLTGAYVGNVVVQ